MQFCFRKFHPRRLVGAVAWTAIVLIIVYQMSILTVSIQVHRPRFAAINYNFTADSKNDTQRLDKVGKDVRAVEEKVKLLRGHFRKKKSYLTVGLCTVPREGALYLPKTLTSLTKNLTDAEKQTTVFVIYLGSYSESWVSAVLDLIDTNFTEGVENGMIQVVQPDPQIYPDFSNITRKTYGDSTERIIWRTKQNIDYAYLFSHCREISQYYIHTEDDVYAVPGYLWRISQLVTKYEESGDLWFCLEFCRLGFIGKLFHSSDLAKMKDYFLLFQFEKPGDLLLTDLKSIMTQFQDIFSPVSLFKHMGKTSSLRNKTHEVRDGRSFLKNKYGKRSGLGRTFNPPARVISSMTPYYNHKPEDAYNIGSHRFFWASRVNEGDRFEVILYEPNRLKAATIRTGHPIRNYDKLQNAIVKYGTEVDDRGSCVPRRALGKLKDGFLHYSAWTYIEFRCLLILVTRSQPGYVIINKIVMAF